MGREAQRIRADVLSGKRRKTSGGLTAADLTRNKDGRIVSRKVSQQAKKNKNLPDRYLKNPPAPRFGSKYRKKVQRALRSAR
jgi:hypothetical protein